MKFRKLGNSAVEVSEISLGCWTMGGLNWVNGSPNGWANVNEDEVTEAIKYGIDQGVNHFDNADVYGNGKAERMLARILKKLGLKSTDFVIATKVGHFPGTAEHAYEPKHIRHQCEQSLINLDREYIDLYYFHHGDFGKDDRYLHGAAEVLDKLVAEGKVRVKGQSAYSAKDFEKTVPIVKPAVLQSWANALDDQFIRPGSPVAKLLEQHKMSFVCFSPLGQGLLLGKYDASKPPEFEPGDFRKGNGAFSAENLMKLAPKIEKLKSKFGSTTEDLASMALNYCLAMPNVCCVIPGFRNLRQVKCNLAGEGKTLGAAEIKYIQDALK